MPVEVKITAAEAGSYKPAPGHWRRFRELAQPAPGAHVHVAASLFHDIAPAHELGIPAVWIDRAGDVSNRIEGRPRPPRAAELPDLTALPDTLERVLAG